MVLATAFDRLRGRRRGFGKAQVDENDKSDDGDATATLTQMETEEVEPQERLWSDSENVDEGHSLRKTILAEDACEAEEEEEVVHPKEDETVQPKDSTKVPLTPSMVNQTTADEDAESTMKVLVSDPEDATNDEADLQDMEDAEGFQETAKDDESAALDEAEATTTKLHSDTEKPKLAHGIERSTDSLPIDDSEGLESVLTSPSEIETNTDSRPIDDKEELQSAVPSLKSPSDKATSSKKQKSETTLDLEDVLASTEHWFAQVSDKTTVTVKDIVKSLCVEYDCSQLPKPIKKAVRNHLTALMKQEEEGGEEEDEVELFGDKEDSSADEGDAETSADGSADNSRRRSIVKKRKKDIGKPSKTSTKLAKKVHAQQLKKRQLESERVKNEELNALQSKQDEAVADAIASALEIDHDTLPQRLELLSKLDAKRLGCFREVQAPPPPKKEDPLVVSPIANAPTEEECSSSDDDMELEIEGPRQSLGLQLVAPLRSPPRPKAKPIKNDRAALRSRLIQMQRTMGNQWLARELGYQDEQEHLQDCRAAEAEKRKRIQQLEETRANQRARQRERLLQGVEADDEEDDAEDEEDQNYRESSEPEDDDEELVLAKEIEEEKTAPITETVKDDNGVEPSLLTNMADAPIETQPIIDNNCPPNTSSVDKVDTGKEATSENTIDTEKDRTTVVVSDPHDVEDDDDILPDTQMPDTAAADPSSLGDSLKKKSSEKITVTERGQTANGTVADLHDFADVEDDEEEIVPATQADITKAHAEQKRPKNLAWKAILEKDKLAAKKKANSMLVDEEADEEEEEEVAGLEDFGFVVKKKKSDGEVEPDGEFNDDDLEDVVDELSDGEGDEDAGEKARKVMEKKEEKLRHKEIVRRMREGYDGRRGGIAAGGASRGLHRFEDLVAADNREDAKRLGLLNDDELDSDDEEKEQGPDTQVDEEEDEAAFLDKIIKDRFLHRSTIQENFEDDDEVDAEIESKLEGEEAVKGKTQEELEELEQERLAKRFSKRARMTRLVESHGERAEFSQSRLIDEDKTMMAELQAMKVSQEYTTVST